MHASDFCYVDTRDGTDGHRTRSRTRTNVADIFTRTRTRERQTNDEEERPVRKVSFTELAPTPTRPRSTKQRAKTFQTHLLTSPENTLIIEKAEIKSNKTKEAKEKKENLAKELVKKHNANEAAARRARRKIPTKGGPKL